MARAKKKSATKKSAAKKSAAKKSATKKSAKRPAAKQSIARALVAAIDKISKRSDVEVLEHFVGKPASAKALDKVRDLPEDLRAFYREINGVDFEWAFRRTPEAFGTLHIPEVGAWKERFEEPVYLVDQHQPEAEAVISRDKPGVLLASNTLPAGLHPFADSFTEYLREAIDAGFGWYWNHHSNEAARTRARLAKPPAKISPLDPGRRVVVNAHISYFCHRPRATMAETELEHYDHRLVKLDAGYTCWVRNRFLAPQKRDLYEQVLAAPERWTEDGAPALLEEIAFFSSSGSTYRFDVAGEEVDFYIRDHVAELLGQFHALEDPIATILDLFGRSQTDKERITLAQLASLMLGVATVERQAELRSRHADRMRALIARAPKDFNDDTNHVLARWVTQPITLKNFPPDTDEGPGGFPILTRWITAGDTRKRDR